MTKKITLGFFAGLIIGLAGSFILFSDKNILDRPVQMVGDGGDQASIMVDAGESIIICSDLKASENPTVFDLLKTCGQEKNFVVSYDTYEEIGVFVTEIAGSSMDKTRFWQYWVNNKYAQVSADNFQVQNGDTVMWKLTDSME